MYFILKTKSELCLFKSGDKLYIQNVEFPEY
jgi:hypothetical protein